MGQVDSSGKIHRSGPEQSAATSCSPSVTCELCGGSATSQTGHTGHGKVRVLIQTGRDPLHWGGPAPVVVQAITDAKAYWY